MTNWHSINFLNNYLIYTIQYYLFHLILFILFLMLLCFFLHSKILFLLAKDQLWPFLAILLRIMIYFLFIFLWYILGVSVHNTLYVTFFFQPDYHRFLATPYQNYGKNSWYLSKIVPVAAIKFLLFCLKLFFKDFMYKYRC